MALRVFRPGLIDINKEEKSSVSSWRRRTIRKNRLSVSFSNRHTHIDQLVLNEKKKKKNRMKNIQSDGLYFFPSLLSICFHRNPPLYLTCLAKPIKSHLRRPKRSCIPQQPIRPTRKRETQMLIYILYIYINTVCRLSMFVCFSICELVAQVMGGRGSSKSWL